jgi:LysR family transcriptional regulator, nitrogen assimilation regulatory protein
MELEAMLGAIDLVRRTDRLTILPGLMIVEVLAGHTIKINPLVERSLELELASIERARHAMSRLPGSDLLVQCATEQAPGRTSDFH